MHEAAGHGSPRKALQDSGEGGAGRFAGIKILLPVDWKYEPVSPLLVVVNEQALPLQPVPRLHHPLCYLRLTVSVFRRPRAMAQGRRSDFQAWRGNIQI